MLDRAGGYWKEDLDKPRQEYFEKVLFLFRTPSRRVLLDWQAHPSTC